MIDWQPDVYECMKRARNAVVSVPPTFQPKLVRELYENGCRENIILEKPIADSPTASETILDFVDKNYVDYRVNYLFTYTNWYQKWLKLVSDNSAVDIDIKWNFMAHHFRHNVDTWKRDHKSGGGALRFYGIHLLAILCDISGLSIKNIIPLYDEENNFYAVTIEGSQKTNKIRLHINSKSDKTLFAIKVDTKYRTKIVVNEDSPFAENRNTSIDIRVPYLESLILSFRNKKLLSYKNKITKINHLWLKCEEFL